eukprot:TRINITY_DN38338_c0_g1_i1.p1 TRINITY_DN38338_c0_g1~~TRINITY_DN38338_c0_g1_i1.p1  ORF type:complete len:407 (+),score=83.28 TRINITY_DN38338_c0_g1_i1:100-1320(+)
MQRPPWFLPPWPGLLLLAFLCLRTVAVRLDEDDAATEGGAERLPAAHVHALVHNADDAATSAAAVVSSRVHTGSRQKTSHETCGKTTVDESSPQTKPSCVWAPVHLRGWCSQEKAQRMCDRLYWCGQEKFIISTVVMCTFCAIIWFVETDILFPCWKVVNTTWPSKYPNEETARWFAWHMQSMWLSVVVVYFSLSATYRLAFATPAAQFSRPQPDVDWEQGLLLNDYVAIAQAAHIFFCYIVVDTIIGTLARVIQPDILVHHTLFIFFCLAVQYNCFAIYLAGMLLLMEVSTIFLNYFTYFRNRLGLEHWTVGLSFVLFALSFIYFRLVVLMWVGSWFLWDLAAGHMDLSEVPQLHLWFICALMLGVMYLQWFWAFQIGGKLVAMLAPTKPKEAAVPLNKQADSLG